MSYSVYLVKNRAGFFLDFEHPTHEDALLIESLGWRLENAIAIELLRCMEYDTQRLFYLRQNKSYEVDFCLVDRNHITQLIQVTYDFTNPTTKLYNPEIGGLLKARQPLVVQT